MHVDLLFALTEEKDFKDSDVATLKQQIEKDRTEFAKFVKSERDGNFAKACLHRLSYYEVVLGKKEHVVITPLPLIPAHDNVNQDNNYTRFLLNTMRGTDKRSWTTEDRIKYLGLHYNYFKLDGVPGPDASSEEHLSDLYIKEFEKAEAGECKARAEYYKALIQAGKVA
ncbi:hypothetical protein H0H93_002256, partial [Arthromyces matolae]